MIKRAFKELLEETPFNKNDFLFILNDNGIFGVLIMYFIYIVFLLISLPFLPFILLNEASKEWWIES